MSGVLVDGRLIHYESLGRGKPIVFLHGWLGSWRYWVPVMENLALEYKTLMPPPELVSTASS